MVLYAEWQIDVYVLYSIYLLSNVSNRQSKKSTIKQIAIADKIFVDTKINSRYYVPWVLIVLISGLLEFVRARGD